MPKRFRHLEWRHQNLDEIVNVYFPPTILIKRIALRNFPEEMVAFYKDFTSGLVLTIPASWLRK